MQAIQLITIHIKGQCLRCYHKNGLYKTYSVSTAKNGAGEVEGSECTPRGWHSIYRIVGLENEINSVFVARQWTGEMYSPSLAAAYPERDWILTRIIQLEGLEPGRNQGGCVDSLSRYIYIHGTPDTTILGIPDSHGCIRMSNKDVIELASRVEVGTKVYIEG